MTTLTHNVSMASKSESVSSTRIKSYKTKGLDLEEGKRKRLEEDIQLRKSRRDEQVLLII